MKTYYAVVLCLVFLTGIACGSGNRFPAAENSLDAAREYIDGELKGEFKKANAYMLQNDTNENHLKKIKENYYSYNDVQRQDYRNASIIILKESIVSDKTSVIYFHNSFDKKEDSIKVVNEFGRWLVTFEK